VAWPSGVVEVRPLHRGRPPTPPTTACVWTVDRPGDFSPYTPEASSGPMPVDRSTHFPPWRGFDPRYSHLDFFLQGELWERSRLPACGRPARPAVLAQPAIDYMAKDLRELPPARPRSAGPESLPGLAGAPPPSPNIGNRLGRAPGVRGAITSATIRMPLPPKAYLDNTAAASAISVPPSRSPHRLPHARRLQRPKLGSASRTGVPHRPDPGRVSTSPRVSRGPCVANGPAVRATATLAGVAPDGYLVFEPLIQAGIEDCGDHPRARPTTRSGFLDLGRPGVLPASWCDPGPRWTTTALENPPGGTPPDQPAAGNRPPRRGC